MNTVATSAARSGEGFAPRDHTPGLHSHGVCWAAIFAGAAGAAVLSLVLMLLGTGIGLSIVSPWGDRGVSGTTIGMSSIVWMTLMQVLASVLGGYLAGRLRHKWVSVHSHEAYFRDTAHGFLAWAIATLATAALLSSAVGNVASAGLKAGTAVVGGAATIAGAGAAGAAGNAASSDAGSDSMNYFTDAMFRPGAAGQTGSAQNGSTPSPSGEVGRIFATSLKHGSMSQPDAQYLAQLVAQRTGVSTEDAQKRVNEAFAKAQQSIQEAKAQAQAAADAARKASAILALWLVVSLLIGAFAASWAATLGGRLRDGLTVSGD